MNSSRKWLLLLLIFTVLTGGAGGVLADRYMFTTEPESKPLKSEQKGRKRSWWSRHGVESHVKTYSKRLGLDGDGPEPHRRFPEVLLLRQRVLAFISVGIQRGRWDQFTFVGSNCFRN